MCCNKVNFNYNFKLILFQYFKRNADYIDKVNMPKSQIQARF